MGRPSWEQSGIVRACRRPAGPAALCCLRAGGLPGRNGVKSEHGWTRAFWSLFPHIPWIILGETAISHDIFASQNTTVSEEVFRSPENQSLSQIREEGWKLNPDSSRETKCLSGLSFISCNARLSDTLSLEGLWPLFTSGILLYLWLGLEAWLSCMGFPVYPDTCSS